MTEVDPDPFEPGEGQGKAGLGGSEAPAAGDPTEGGKRGEIGETGTVAADEPDDGNRYPAGGGNVAEEQDAPPVSDAGPDA